MMRSYFLWPNQVLFDNVRYPFLLLLLLFLGCNQGGAAVSNGSGATVKTSPVASNLSLTIKGYNYTDRYINDFSINFHGGGDINVSGPDTGGGGSVCCMPFLVADPTKNVVVRWQANACYFKTKSTISDEVFDDLYSYFKEERVPVIVNPGRSPKYFEVHIFPTGVAKVLLTETPSAPLTVMPKNREDNSDFPRCPNDEKPKKG
jgi:hypothetical protein